MKKIRKAKNIPSQKTGTEVGANPEIISIRKIRSIVVGDRIRARANLTIRRKRGKRTSASLDIGEIVAVGVKIGSIGVKGDVGNSAFYIMCLHSIHNFTNKI